MGIPVEKDLVNGEHVERRESDGTVIAEGEHAQEVPVVKAAKKTKGWLARITGVAP